MYKGEINSFFTSTLHVLEHIINGLKINNIAKIYGLTAFFNEPIKILKKKEYIFYY